MSTSRETSQQFELPSNNPEGEEDRRTYSQRRPHGNDRPAKRAKVTYVEHGSSYEEQNQDDDYESVQSGNESIRESPASTASQKRPRGRPKGSQNKARTSGAGDGANERRQGGDSENEEEETAERAPLKRGRGRPPGSKNKRRRVDAGPKQSEDEEGEGEGLATALAKRARDARPVSKRGPGRVARDLELDTQDIQRRPKDIETAKSYLPIIDISPDSNIHRHGVWTGEQIEKLEASWSPSDDAQMNPKNNDEHPLWRMMVDVFSCVPRDLFTYGLKLRIKDTKRKLIDASGEEIPDLNMGGYFCKLLLRLGCHPMWYGDLSRLRYALQLAICTRITNHVSPLGPLDPSFITGKMNSRIKGNIILASWSLNGLPGDLGMKELAEQLDKVVKDHQKREARDESERLLFLVEDKDIVNLTEALDTLQIFGKRKWEQTESYYKAYRSQRTSRNSHPPTTIEEMKDWKKIGLLADKRDALIRSRILHHDLELAWFDVPKKDIMTARYLDKASRLSEEQRSVLRGMVNSPNLPDGYRIEEDESDDWTPLQEPDSGNSKSGSRGRPPTPNLGILLELDADLMDIDGGPANEELVGGNKQANQPTGEEAVGRESASDEAIDGCQEDGGEVNADGEEAVLGDEEAAGGEEATGGKEVGDKPDGHTGVVDGSKGTTTTITQRPQRASPLDKEVKNWWRSVYAPTHGMDVPQVTDKLISSGFNPDF